MKRKRASTTILTGIGVVMLAVGTFGAVSAVTPNKSSNGLHQAATAQIDTGPGPVDSQASGDLTEIDKLPGCILVVDRSGKTAGCVKKSDEFAPPPVFDSFAKSGGVPVYDIQNQTTIVGHLDGGIGFVPEALVNEDGQLRDCTDALIASLKDSADSQPLTSGCRALLTDQGYPDATLMGR